MADSYAQLAISRSMKIGQASYSSALQAHERPTDKQGMADLEDKVLSLAKLLKSCQMCQEDATADHQQHILQLAGKIKQLEEAVQRQAISSSMSAAPSAFTIKAVAERLVLVEQQLNEGFTDNQRVHTHNAEVIHQLETRLLSAESQLAEDKTEQLARLRLEIEPVITDLVTSRLARFENEVQARLMIASAAMTAGSQDASPAVCRTPSKEVATLYQSGLEDRLQRFEELVQRSISELVEGQPQQGLQARKDDIEVAVNRKVAAAMLSVQHHAEVSASRHVQAALQHIQGSTVTREELQGVVEQLCVVADTHASMQLAVSQLQTVCPELSRLVTLMKGGAKEGTSAAGKQAQAASLLIQHAETLAQVLSGQLQQACSLADVAHRDLCSSSTTGHQPGVCDDAAVAPFAPVASGGRGRPASLSSHMLGSHLCRVLEETRCSIDSLSLSLRQASGDSAGRTLSAAPQADSRGTQGSYPRGGVVAGKENDHQGRLRSRLEKSQAAPLVLQQALVNVRPDGSFSKDQDGASTGFRSSSAEKRQLRLRKMYAEMKHIQK